MCIEYFNKLQKMVKIRLYRGGRKQEPSYKIVAIDSRRRREGKCLEQLGFYNPQTKQCSLNFARLSTRLDAGARPTETVCYIILSHTLKILSRKTKAKKRRSRR